MLMYLWAKLIEKNNSIYPPVVISDVISGYEYFNYIYILVLTYAMVFILSK